jgi:hypothetical protein
MDDPSEHALVVEALTCRLSNAVEWKDDRTMNRVRNELSTYGLTPRGIKELTREHVRAGGPSTVAQVREKRLEYSDFPYYYRVVVPIDCFRHGLFVEMVLIDPDRESPEVALVNAHEQTK